MLNDLIISFEQYPAFFYLTVLFVSLAIGSFLNVVILRLPKMLHRGWYQECREFLADEVKDVPAKEEPIITLSKPSSTCPKCGHNIRFYENIPVVSYLLLKGKCSSCQTPISLRYPAIEALTAIASFTVAYVYGYSLQTLFLVPLTWVFIVLIFIDMDHMLLPDQLTQPLLWFVLLSALWSVFLSPSDALVGAAAGYLSLWSVYWAFKLLTGKEGMGYGDFKLLAVIGACVGWLKLPMVILLSSAVGAIIGLGLMLIGKAERGSRIPFGPYIAIAGWIAMLWGDGIMNWYLEALV